MKVKFTITTNYTVGDPPQPQQVSTIDIEGQITNQDALDELVERLHRGEAVDKLTLFISSPEIKPGKRTESILRDLRNKEKSNGY